MADNKLFNRLRKLFSTNVVIRNVKGDKLRVMDTDNTQAFADLSTNFMKTRFPGFYSTYGRYGYNELSTISTQRPILFRDYELMETDPIIASALDIYSDECVGPETIIPLLDGRKLTIKELFDSNMTNFWVYSLDENLNEFIPSKCEKVAYNGKKNMYNVVLEDGTSIKCTENHLWVTPDGLKNTSELSIGSSIKAMPTKLSDNKFMTGYEMLLENGKWKYTHRLVANKCDTLLLEKNTLKQTTDNIVIHHNSFDKLNNSPEYLQWMEYSMHRKTHSDYNKKIWSDPVLAIEYKEKIREAHRNYWTDDLKQKVSERQSAFMSEYTSNMSSEDRCIMYGRSGSQNGMYGNGDKLLGEKNGRYNLDKNRPIDIDIDHYISKIRDGFSNGQLQEYFNLLRQDVFKLNKNVCNIYGVRSLKQFKSKTFGISISDIKNDVLELKYKFKNPIRKINLISSKYGVTTSDLTNLLIRNGYNNFSDLIHSMNNHRVVSIEPVGMEDAYDLVNVGKSHIYALESNDGSKIYCHNCTTQDEFGTILSIKSDNDKVKKTLENLFYDILNIEFNAWSWIRNMCKYGDAFLKLEIAENYGIVNVIPLSPYELEREEGFDSMNPFIVRFKNSAIYNSSNPKTDYYENYEIAHFRLLGDANFLPYGKCLSQTTHIDTEFGSKFIRDIKKGDKVWTFNYNLKKFELTDVLNVINSGTKKLLRISTPHNFIESSIEHPVLVYDVSNSDFIYKQANDIKIGDLLVVSTNKMKMFSGDIKIDKSLPVQNLDGPKLDLYPYDILPEYVDNEFAEFIGFMLGDGWISKNDLSDSRSYSVKFSLGTDDFLNKRYIDMLEKYSNKKCDIQKFKGKSKTAVIYSKSLHTILKNMGLYGDAHTKRIPSWVHELSDDKKLSFITGLTNADGSISVDEWCNRYGIWLCNKELILDFKKLIQSLNIKTSIPLDKYYDDLIEICGNECNRTETHSFYYYMDADEKTQMMKYNFLNLEKDSHFLLEPVRRISDVGEDITWDIQVNSENSNFVANGIVVHNSMIESARRVWKQLQLMEDAMMIHRIMRAPDKRIFHIDVGNIPPNEVDQYMKLIIANLKKQPLVDPRTGDYNLKYNLMNMTEDYYLPVRGGDSGTSVDNIPGLEYNAIEDIEYLRNKMMAALKIPKAFLGYEEGISGKATLAAEDVRFSRTIERIQKIFVSELTKLAILHLYVQGFDDSDIVDFDLSMSSPSTIYEQEMISLWTEKVGLIRDLKETKLLSDDWIYKNILKLSDNEIQEERELVIDDIKNQFRMSQIENEGNDPFKTGQTFGTPYDITRMQQTGKSGNRNIDLGDTNFKVDYDRNMDDSENDPSGTHMHYYKPDDEIKSQYDIDMAERDRKRKLRTHYGQDGHSRGRDPLGRKEYVKSYDIDKRLSNKSKPNKNRFHAENILKTKEIIVESLKLSKYSKTNNENIIIDDENTFLNEKNIIEQA